MDPTLEAACKAVRKAVEKCPVGVDALAEIDAADVVTLARAIKPEERSQRVTDLGVGALKALGKKSSLKVLQLADELRHLLTSAPGTHDPLAVPTAQASLPRNATPAL